LATVVENAVETTEPLLDSSGHELTICLPTEPVRLVADKTRLAQVVANILNNAAKYSPPHSRICLSAAVEGEQVTISVKDHGIGIAPEILPRIFDLFVQGDCSLGRDGGGLGVGLALSKKLVELHGGTIDAASAGPGQGTEIVVRLPHVPVPRATECTASAECAGMGVKSHLRVLVVDDSADLAESTSMLLELIGHEVQIATDGPAALRLAESFHPDAVLLDIGMPHMTGYDVARRLRQSSAGQRALLIAVTGWGQEEDRRRTREAGFDHHLTKPVELRQLEHLFGRLG
jgi:two-component system, chemotaxis family, CheB/CheR fusion protein